MYLISSIKRYNQVVFTRTDELVDGVAKYEDISPSEAYYIMRTINEPKIYSREYYFDSKPRINYAIRDDSESITKNLKNK